MVNKFLFAWLGIGAMFIGVTPVLAQNGDYKNSSDPLVRCMYEARQMASDPDYSTPDCANKFIEGNVVTFPETAFKKAERGMIEKMEIAEVSQYFRDWLNKDLALEYKREGDYFFETNKDLAQQLFHRAVREQKGVGIGDFSSLIVRRDYVDIIHIGTGANDIEFTEGKDPVWTFDYGEMNLLVFVGYCKISLWGKVYDDMANEYFDENSEFFKNHHVAVSWDDDKREKVYKVIDGGSTEGTLDAILNPTLLFAKKMVDRIAGVCGSKNIQTVALGTDNEVEAMVEKVPAESDLKISENATRLNDELEALFGKLPVETGIKPKVPELTGTTPYLFDNPLSTKDGRYFSFTANAKNHIIEYRGGNKITLEFPDGTTFVPESGDFIRVPVGTKIKTEMGLYQGGSQYDNIGKFGMSSLGITNVAGGSSITLGGGSVVELMPAASGGAGSNVKLNDGEVRIGTGGFEGTDRPDLPTEIQFEGRQDVVISWDGTDFAVSYDRESEKITAEIYDGTIKLAVGEKKYSLSSKYGDEIKRIEIEGSGEVAEKIAIPRAVWRERLKEEPETVVSAEAELNGRRSWIGLSLVIGVVGLAAVGGFWYRKRFGTWPLETKWRPILTRLSGIYTLVTSRLKRK